MYVYTLLFYNGNYFNIQVGFQIDPYIKWTYTFPIKMEYDRYINRLHSVPYKYSLSHNCKVKSK